jgi:transcriptional regulator with XRE-family HTH domain
MKPNLIRALRSGKGITQAQAAAKLKISPASYNRFENGSLELKPSQIKTLAKMLGTTPETLTDRAAASDHARVVNAILNCSKRTTPRNAAEFCVRLPRR